MTWVSIFQLRFDFQAKEDSRELHYHNMDKNSLKVFDDEIDNLSLSNMDFVYDGEGMLFSQLQKHSVLEQVVKKFESAKYLCVGKLLWLKSLGQ